MTARQARTRLLLVMALLLGLHFYLRPRLFDVRLAPDFLLVALLIYALRARPGNAAIAGFAVGLVADALVPARFGAAILAHTVVGYLTAWGRSVFFADNLVVNAAVFLGGLWVRDFLVLMASGTTGSELLSHLTLWAPLHGLSTAVAGVIVLLLFRDWLEIRLQG